MTAAASLSKEVVHSVYLLHIQINSEMKELVVKKGTQSSVVPSQCQSPQPQAKQDFVEAIASEPSSVHGNWVLKSILDEINPRLINWENSNKRSPMLPQDKRWGWWLPLSNVATDSHNGNPPSFTGINQNYLFFWSVKQLYRVVGGVLIEKISFGYMCMWNNVKGKSKTLSPPSPSSARSAR